MQTTQSPPAPGSVPGIAPEFAAIYAEHARPVYYLALRILANPAQAEDATHDIFLKAFGALESFRGQSAMRTWLYRIALNHCRNVAQCWHQRTMINNIEDDFWEVTSAKGASPSRLLESAELGGRIQKTLQRLPEEYRLLLLLVADEELSYEQIGELTDQSGDAVRGKLHRARKAFGAYFQQSE